MKIHPHNIPADLSAYRAGLTRYFGGLFLPRRDIFIARAPGRLDVMGGSAEYSGSVVLEGTLNEGIIVGVQKRRDRRIVIKSLGIEEYGMTGIVDFHLDDLQRSYGDLSRMIALDPGTRWTAYVLGVFAVLQQEGLVEEFEFGATIGISSTIPIDAAVGSSAALEVAAMFAVQHAFEIPLKEFQIARACQILENRIVGSSSGILDQVTCAMGEQDKLLALRCQPHELLKKIPVPEQIEFIGINSDIKRAGAGQRAGETRIAAFMGRKILFSQLRDVAEEVPYAGYLCNVGEEEWQKRYRKTIPLKITGEDFLRRYGSHDDVVTEINPKRTFRPRSRAEHQIKENSRTVRFMELIESYSGHGDEKDLVDAGRLMYDSHKSYRSRCGLGAPETDLLVELAQEYGPEQGIFGAKTTGNGCGGTVVLLTAAGRRDFVRDLAARYFDRTKNEPDIFFGSSPGALEMGITVENFK